MNEQRVRKTQYLNNQMHSDLDAQWDELSMIINTLVHEAFVRKNPELFDKIIKMIKVIGQNKPNKKLIKSLKKRVEDIEQTIRLRQYNTKI